METGLGGRKDPATELEACESVITTIGMDHMDILGDTIERIAIEKSMIVRPSGYVITMPQKESVMNILESTCHLMNARLVKIGRRTSISMRTDALTFSATLILKSTPSAACSISTRPPP